MNESITQYLTQISISPIMRDQIDSLLIVAAEYLDEDVVDIFLDEASDSNESKVTFENLVIYSLNHVLEYHKFMIEGRYNIFIFSPRSRIKTLNIEKNFDRLQAIVPTSRITVKWYDSVGNGGSYYATGENCRHSAAILKKYILPSYKTNAI